MLNPLIILEQHFGTAQREFIIENSANLKRMGYHSFLLENDKTQSMPEFKKHLEMILQSIPEAHPFYNSTKLILKMLLTLESNDITCRFIDPETQVEGMRLNDAVQRARTSEQKKHAFERKEYFIEQRDHVMSKEILKDTKQYHGGVIAMIGYKHKKLVELLTSELANTPRFLLFSNQEDAVKSMLTSPEDHALWNNVCSNSLYRTRYYNNDAIKHFNTTDFLPFSTFKEKCGMIKEIQPPTVVTRFSEITEQNYSCTQDIDYVVTATASFNDIRELEKTSQKIKSSFPGLSFFVGFAKHSYYLEVTGLNLPENNEVLNKGFKPG
ncbi:MAG: hypothetical protein WC785_04850 [Tatlockia sp.]|jgi:hypothetical protein